MCFEVLAALLEPRSMFLATVLKNILHRSFLVPPLRLVTGYAHEQIRTGPRSFHAQTWGKRQKGDSLESDEDKGASSQPGKGSGCAGQVRCESSHLWCLCVGDVWREEDHAPAHAGSGNLRIR